ncbi:MAG: RNA polymerase factor sigma-54 [Solirubrobacterales bacterium]
MRLSHEIALEQQQKLLMTPELRQAIMILQLSSLELNEHVQKELDENPVLEVRDEGDDENLPTADDDRDDELVDPEWKEYFLDRSDLGYSQPVDEERRNSLESYVAAVPTLREHLTAQLNLTACHDDELRIGRFLIGNIDENGYLRVSIPDTAADLGVTEAAVEIMLTAIQSFDPSGVGARTIAECLRIQLEQQGKLTPEIARILEEFLDEIGRGRLSRIAAAVGLTVTEVQEIADLIRTLDPKPGSTFAAADEVRYVVPDVIVELVNGEYVILVNDGASPRLALSQLYQDMLRQPGMFNEDARNYLKDKLNSAVWLIRSIEHRRMTLYNVARTLVDVQRDFLDKGVKSLKPLNLRQIADMTGLHESTISRATNNKYIQTPRGVFELKYFFSGGIHSSEGGESFSSRSVKKTIEEMIHKEDTHKPLSDQQIAETLNEQGFEISRRTVAKYRTELGIGSTAKRKRY